MFIYIYSFHFCCDQENDFQTFKKRTKLWLFRQLLKYTSAQPAWALTSINYKFFTYSLVLFILIIHFIWYRSSTAAPLSCMYSIMN